MHNGEEEEDEDEEEGAEEEEQSGVCLNNMRGGEEGTHRIPEPCIASHFVWRYHVPNIHGMCTFQAALYWHFLLGLWFQHLTKMRNAATHQPSATHYFLNLLHDKKVHEESCVFVFVRRVSAFCVVAYCVVFVGFSAFSIEIRCVFSLVCYILQ